MVLNESWPPMIGTQVELPGVAVIVVVACT
jgi:hypothetical protein